jgi:hypothetical protein
MRWRPLQWKVGRDNILKSCTCSNIAAVLSGFGIITRIVWQNKATATHIQHLWAQHCVHRQTAPRCSMHPVQITPASHSLAQQHPPQPPSALVLYPIPQLLLLLPNTIHFSAVIALSHVTRMTPNYAPQKHPSGTSLFPVQ